MGFWLITLASGTGALFCTSLILNTRLKCQLFLLVKSAQFDNLKYPIKTRDKETEINERRG